jgi:hypothetical protein
MAISGVAGEPETDALHRVAHRGVTHRNNRMSRGPKNVGI